MKEHCLWTIGHSTRPLPDFLQLLNRNNIQLMVDVRRIPFSRRCPQFHQESLREALQQAGLAYRHLPSLGGRRKARIDSENIGWRNMSFRGYADYMQTPAFERGLYELIDLAEKCHAAIMCAEAVPWRCHRSLIADALVAQGWTVLEIIGAEQPKQHVLPAWARVVAGNLTYPGAAPLDLLSGLLEDGSEDRRSKADERSAPAGD